VLPCLLSYITCENEAVRDAAVRALSAALKSCTTQDDCVARLLSRITRGKSQTGIIADPVYACHVSAFVQLLHFSTFVSEFYIIMYT